MRQPALSSVAMLFFAELRSIAGEDVASGWSRAFGSLAGALRQQFRTAYVCRSHVMQDLRVRAG